MLGVVAVDVEFIPRDVYRHRSPRHGAFAFAIRQKRAACLVRGNQAHHSTHLPRLVGREHIASVPIARDGYFATLLAFVHAVNAHRSFQSGKNVAAGNHRTACVAHHFWHLALVGAFHVEVHCRDAFHFDVGIGGDGHFGAQIVRVVAQHRLPVHGYAVLHKFCAHSLARIVFRETASAFYGRQWASGHHLEVHIARGEALTAVELDGEQIVAGTQAHCLAACKREFAAGAHKFCREQIVAKHVFAVVFVGNRFCPRCSWLFGLWKNHTVCLEAEACRHCNCNDCRP